MAEDVAIDRLVDAIATRVRAEPDLDDFLDWTAGTLEYWVQIISSSVGKTFGWAATTEVPYITGMPATSSKSDTKWADGAILLPNALGLLLEVKTVPAIGSKPSPTMRKIPTDLAALVSADWGRTLAQTADKYSGEEWTHRRAQMQTVHALQLALVHGDLGDHQSLDENVSSEVRAGLRTIENRFATVQPPHWLDTLRTALIAEGPQRHEIHGLTRKAVLYSWVAPIVR